MVITSKGIAIILVPVFFLANNHATLLAIDHASLVLLMLAQHQNAADNA
jgi:hypothetical protein